MQSKSPSINNQELILDGTHGKSVFPGYGSDALVTGNEVHGVCHSLNSREGRCPVTAVGALVLQAAPEDTGRRKEDALAVRACHLHSIDAISFCPGPRARLT